MIKQLRLLVLAALALGVGSALTSASALAAECASSPKGACISVLNVLTESIQLLAHSEKPTTLEVEKLATIECEKADSEPTIDETKSAGLAILPFDITFSGSCKVIGAPACTVVQPILTANIVGTVSAVETGSGDANFAPTNGGAGLFATVRIENCEQESFIVVKGTQLCLISSMETELTLHTLSCEKGQGKLLDGTKKAEFLGAFDLTVDPEDDVAIKLELF